MQVVNLIPTPRREIRRINRLTRRWVVACGAYALIILSASLTCRAMWEPTESDLPSKLGQVESHAAELRIYIAERSAKLDAVTTQLNIARDIANHPNWTVMLAVLADQLGESIVLRRCSIRPSNYTPQLSGRNMPGGKTGMYPKGNSVRPREFMVQISGLAQSSKEVSHLLLRIEKTGLFSDVKLINGTPTQYLGIQAIAFEIECVLDGRGASHP